MEERRMHQRFSTSIRIEYRVQIPESPEVSWIGCGVLKDVSIGGVYFRSSDSPPLEQGQIRNFTITSAESHLNFSKAAYISSKGRVVRVEPPQSGFHDIGVALEFLSGTVFSEKLFIGIYAYQKMSRITD